MKQLLLGLLLATCSQPVVHAVDNLRLANIRSVGMGGNEATQSSLHNPSLLAFYTKKQIEINYFNRYAMKELSTLNATFCLPNAWLPAQFSIFSFGYDAYRESMFRLAVGKRLSERWTAGLSIQYALLQTELPEMGAARLSADLGVTFQPVDKLLVGLLIVNTPSFSLQKKAIEVKDFSSYLVQLGFQWEIINHLLIAASAGTSESHSLLGSIGVEYRVYERFFIRAGVKAPPIAPSLGVGCNVGHFSINIAALYHATLGISTGAGLSYSF